MSKITPNRILVVVLLVAAGLAAGLIAVSVTGAGDDAAPANVHGAAATATLLAGIPQHGNVLGDPDAPVTLVEYADFQCPYCAGWALESFPTLVREYVRAGKLRMVFHGVAIIGPDSVPALETAIAAGEQGRLWHMTELLFHNQGTENTGWVTDDLLRSLGEAVPGLDAGAMMDARDSEPVQTGMGDAQEAVVDAGVRVTPSFELGPTGGEMAFVEGALPLDTFRQEIDRLLAR